MIISQLQRGNGGGARWHPKAAERREIGEGCFAAHMAGKTPAFDSLRSLGAGSQLRKIPTLVAKDATRVGHLYRAFAFIEATPSMRLLACVAQLLCGKQGVHGAGAEAFQIEGDKLEAKRLEYRGELGRHGGV